MFVTVSESERRLGLINRESSEESCRKKEGLEEERRIMGSLKTSRHVMTCHGFGRLGLRGVLFFFLERGRNEFRD